MRHVHVVVHIANVVLGILACYDLELHNQKDWAVVWVLYGFLVMLPFALWWPGRPCYLKYFPDDPENKRRRHMPHDKNGKPLAVGDEVTLRGKVTQVHQGETACNVTVEAAERPEGEGYIPTIAGNSRFYEKVEPAEATPPPAES